MDGEHWTLRTDYHARAPYWLGAYLERGRLGLKADAGKRARDEEMEGEG